MPEEILTPAPTIQENAAPVTPATPTDPVEATEQPTLAESEIKENGDQKKVDAVVPEKYEVKMPEGVELDAAMLESFSPIFKELGLSQEAVQKLADTYVPLIQATTEKTRQEAMASYKQITEEWRADTMKELGSNAKTELAFAGKAIQKFGGNELREVLQHTGVGNHKALVSFFAKVGKTIAEDTFVPGGSTPPVDALSVMYPSMKQ